MKFHILTIFLIIYNLSYSQITNSNKFDLNKYEEFGKKSHNQNNVEFYKSDSLVTMNYVNDGISTCYIGKGNFEISYIFYPNLQLKLKRQSIFGKMHSAEYFVGIEKEYSDDGKLVSEFDWDKAPIDENVAPPNFSIWEIEQKMIEQFKVNIIDNNKLYYIFLEKEKKMKFPVYHIAIIYDQNYYFLYKYNAETGTFISKQKKKK